MLCALLHPPRNETSSLGPCHALRRPDALLAALRRPSAQPQRRMALASAFEAAFPDSAPVLAQDAAVECTAVRRAA